MNFLEVLFCLTGCLIFCLGGVVLTGYVIWWLIAKTLETFGAYGKAFQIAVDYFERKRKESK